MIVGSFTQFSVAFLLALCCATSVSAQLNMNNICLLVGDGYQIASENSCTDYYSCSGGVATQQSCGSSLYFSKDQQACVPSSQVNCLAAGSAPCEGRQLGTWAPMANSCSGYYYCGANGPQAGFCPGGENFDSVSQSCQYSDVYGCSVNGGSGDSADGGATVTVNLCSFIQNGVYFGSASNCAGWNTCNNNIMTSGACSNNLVYNVHLRTCDYASDWGCSQVTYDPNLVGSTSTNGGSCTSNDTNKAATPCDSYYACNNITMQWILNKCSMGYFYDVPTQTCVPRMMAHNDCDRCIDSTQNFVNAYSTLNCSSYLYCVNGIRAGSGVCLNGYFNEEDGACVTGDGDPGFGCCNPTAGISTTTGATTVAGGTDSNNNGTTVAGGTTAAGTNGAVTTVAGSNDAVTTDGTTVTTDGTATT